MKKDELGDRMKMYESSACPDRLMPLVPVFARLDGRAFHSFTRGLKRPFDPRFTEMMNETARYLMEQTDALVSYAQSDEITLLWYSEDYESQIFFDRRIQKMISTLAALATAKFNSLIPEGLPEKAHLLKAGKFPTFDCRVWVVPNKIEAANTILWRVEDASRNSILAVGHAHLGHKAMHGLSCQQVLDALKEQGIFWDRLGELYRYGNLLRKVKVSRPFTDDEIDKLPAKHAARSNPGLVVERWELTSVLLDGFSKASNRVGVLFDGEKIRIKDAKK